MKASVLISTFNRPKYLAVAIQSVIEQTMTDWELLIINDGGTDVQDVVDSFNDDRITYFHSRENKGPGARFNELLGMAKGDYIAYLGDDDLFYPNHLDVLCRALDEHPEVDVVYSDLYAVDCYIDNEGNRIPLSKRISVSRGFNRFFEFFHNHVLHGSMMHRREFLAFDVGGFVDGVTSLIEWGFLRKAAMICDFLHVEAPTGEYYTPVGGGDRLSYKARSDPAAFEMNKRRIKAARPMGHYKDWPKIKKVVVIYPIIKYFDTGMVIQLIDSIGYPVYYMFPVLNESLAAARSRMGELANLPNIDLVPLTCCDSILDYYIQTTKYYDCADADYVFLATDNLLPHAVEQRIMGGVEYLESNPFIAGVRWTAEKGVSNLDVLIRRSEINWDCWGYGMKRPSKGVQTLPKSHLPTAFAWDKHMTEARTAFNRGEFETAYEKMHLALALTDGVPTKQFMAEWLVNICIATGRIAEAKNFCRALINRGYIVDNGLRIAKLYAADGEHDLAIEATEKWCELMGLTKQQIMKLPVGIGDTQLQWVLTYRGMNGL